MRNQVEHYKDNKLLRERLGPYNLLADFDISSSMLDLLDLNGYETVSILGAGDGSSGRLLEARAHEGKIMASDLHGIRKYLWPRITQPEFRHAVASQPLRLGNVDLIDRLGFSNVPSQEAKEIGNFFETHTAGNMEMSEGDAQNVYFIADKSVDTAIAEFLLTMFDERGRGRVIRELGRIAKPDAKVAFTTTGANNRPLTYDLFLAANEDLGVTPGSRINAPWPIEIAVRELVEQDSFKRAYICEYRGEIPVRSDFEFQVCIGAAATLRDQCIPEPDEKPYKEAMQARIGEIARAHHYRDQAHIAVIIASNQEQDAAGMGLTAAMLGMSFRQLK